MSFSNFDWINHQAIGGLLGTSGGQSGTGISGPSTVPIVSPVTQDQVNKGLGRVDTSLDANAALLAALNPQGGPANQTQVLGDVNKTTAGLEGLNPTGVMGSAMGGTGTLAGQLGQAGGVGIQTGAVGGLQGVAGQQAGTLAALKDVAAGRGANPAQAMLNQATGADVANQAALMAGQRGAGANVGLMARQAAQQGAGIQQQAVGQGATMQAQQQLGALGQEAGVETGMAGTQGQIAGIGAGLTGQEAGVLNQQFGQGAGTVGQIQAGQGLGAGITQSQVGNAIGVTGQGIQGALGSSGQQLGARGQFQGQQVGQQGNVNTVQGGMANTVIGGQQGVVGGILGGVGKGIAAAAAYGGEIKKMADGGDADTSGAAPMVQAPTAPTAGGPRSSFGNYLGNMGSDMAQTPGQKALKKGVEDFGAGIGTAFSKMGSSDDGETNPAGNLVSATPPGTGSATGDFLGGASSTADFLGGAGGMSKGGLAANGGHVSPKKPGQKAEVKGDSLKNDKVPAMLSSQEIVLPRSVTMSDDPVRSAADFVQKVIAKRRVKR